MLKTTIIAAAKTPLTRDTGPPESLPVSRRAKLALHYRWCVESRFYPPVLKNEYCDFCDFKIVTGIVVEIISKCTVTGEKTGVRTDHGGNSGRENRGDARDANRFYLFWLETWCMRRGIALGRRVEQHSIIVDGVTEGKRDYLGDLFKFTNSRVHLSNQSNRKTLGLGATDNWNEAWLTEMVKECCKLNYKISCFGRFTSGSRRTYKIIVYTKKQNIIFKAL